MSDQTWTREHLDRHPYDARFLYAPDSRILVADCYPDTLGKQPCRNVNMETNVANAARLALCWNVLLPIPSAALEDVLLHPGPVERLLALRDVLDRAAREGGSQP